MASIRKISQQDKLVRQGVWSIRYARPGRFVQGATAGLIGISRIAMSVVKKLSGFEIKFLAYDSYLDQKVVEQYGATPVELPNLLSYSDFVLLHIPLNEITMHLIGESEFKMMKPTAIIVNTSHGKLPDTVVNPEVKQKMCFKVKK